MAATTTTRLSFSGTSDGASRSVWATEGRDAPLGGGLSRPVAIGLGVRGDLRCRHGRGLAGVVVRRREGDDEVVVPHHAAAGARLSVGGRGEGRRRPAAAAIAALSWVATAAADELSLNYLQLRRSDIAAAHIRRRCRRHVASSSSSSSSNSTVVMGSSSPSSSGVDNQSGPRSLETVPDTDFTITKVSFGTIGLVVGVSFLSFGFGAYFTLLPGSEWSALLLTYGFPLTLIGFALKYAELKPVPCISYADAYALRQTQATPTLTQVREDVTRYRYGDEKHLDEALKRIFRYGQAGGIQRRFAPTLTAVREEVLDGKYYTLVLIFDAPSLNLDDFESRKQKFSSFFGPGVTAQMLQAGDTVYEVKLVADGDGGKPAG
ncbi:hypothetical protein CBR_g44937 [Chara braunii]|uniref:Thylakoid membrane protein slr0575 n=1 Tax=Chara braunii TaxID=69332 RepID=A0A388LY67_CHABU|nr:hypothetical protein CBR_g44937 [Chara braunii]|eukprot:GBG87201.1 hypothetical protein CBR_g44937 [Chara braunii]